MTRATKKLCSCKKYQCVSRKPSVSQESSSSDQETEMQSPSLQQSTGQAQFVPAMFMPYIEGPKMD